MSGIPKVPAWLRIAGWLLPWQIGDRLLKRQRVRNIKEAA
jgi:hypothetical protein